MSEMQEPPYPSGVKAKGWRFELDPDQVECSDTWALAPAVARPWLLMMWLRAWREAPCGSLPADKEVLAAKLGMPLDLWAEHERVLMRGWRECSDGRLYHDTLTARVIEMLEKRRSDSDRQAAKRAREAMESRLGHAGVTRDTNATHKVVTPESSTDHGPLNEIPNLLTQVSAPRPEERPAKAGIPDCPHQAVLALWAEVLPALPQHLPSQWRGTRADHLRARWRETAVDKGWRTEAEGLAYLRKLFAYLGKSPFLAGKVPPKTGTRQFVCELEWLVNPQNWAKVLEGKYHEEAHA